MAVAINRDTSLAINRINRDASLIYLKEAEVSQWGGAKWGECPWLFPHQSGPFNWPKMKLSFGLKDFRRLR
jgi:hypothetical protein